jgi:hypothetical protein
MFRVLLFVQGKKLASDQPAHAVGDEAECLQVVLFAQTRDQ